MIVNSEVLEDLYREAGHARRKRGEEYTEEGRVKITKVIYDDPNNLEISSNVQGNYSNYDVYIKIANSEIDDLRCTCPDYKEHYGSCKHIIATMMEFEQNSDYVKIFTGKEIKEEQHENHIPIANTDRTKSRMFKQLINEIYSDNIVENEENKILEGTVELSIKLIKSIYNNNIKLEIKIGTQKQMYKLKDIVEFYENMVEHKNYKYGAKLEFVHTKAAFKKESRPILDFILKYAEIIKYANDAAISSGYYGRTLGTGSIIISNSAMDELFDVLEGKYVTVSMKLAETKILFTNSQPDVEIILEEVKERQYKITTNIDVFEYELIQGRDYTYMLYNNRLYRCSKHFKESVLKILQIYRKNYASEIKFTKSELSTFFSLVVPTIKNNINLEKVDKNKIENYIPEELGVKVLLDYDDANNIVADIRFCYGDEEFNPLAEDRKDIARDILKEDEATNTFARTGFMLDSLNSRLILVDEEKIYNFLVMGIENYMQKFEVLATDSFRQREVTIPKIGALGVRVENNLLNIDLSKFNFDKNELKEIMQKYKLKRKFHRLQNGSFLDLESNESLDFINSIITGTNLSYDKLEQDNIQLPVYRALYMERLLKNNNITITKNEEYTNLVNNIEEKNIEGNLEIPKALNAELRDYQKVGFNWLKTLDEYKLGGILADDMGLGKTIQLIAVITSYVENNNNPKPSIVVCPSSLSLNWYKEIQKFAPDLKALVISGGNDERRKEEEIIPEYDVVITSYDLLKRDIDVYKEKNYEFKYIIADEAQYIKNNNTQNARSIKKIKAETKYALTGTPIENSLSELWSIFDFIMPGYLFDYKKFKEIYEMPIVKNEDIKCMEKLKMQIEPFILRRIKEDVLTELPDKTITVLNNKMHGEQEKIYLSYMEQAKKEAKNELSTNGFEKSQIKILALLTRLRQICCHPSLFLENYEGESSKLNQCIEILKEAISGGHKILLFSGYTSMFEIIEKELKKEGIQYYKLTGSTKVNQRLQLVDDFNKDPKVKVFLISLKAGGTGLNLIGADMVIHYDPWWNLSAENQATDRTYRIGQKRNVQVYKMITQNSIEEKIYEMQQRKAKLIDNMLSTQETFISRLSKEDIMELFEI